jgi:HlyD family secretion protein
MILLRKFSLWAALLGIVAVILMVRKSTAIEPMPAPLFEPAQKPWARGIAAAGIVEALRENTSIGVPTAALVTKVYVKPWDKVEAGSPLLQLDDRDLKAQIKIQQANVSVAEAELAKASRQHERTELLRASNIVSQQEADNDSDDYAVAQARVESAHATVAQTQTLIERLTIRSPIDATVLQINTRTGEYTVPGANTPPLLLGSIDEVQVRADVDEQVAPRVKPGSKAVGYLKGETQNPIPLEFVRVEPFVTPKLNLTGSSSERVDTRVLQVIYKFPNDLTRRIYVGQQMDLFIAE